MSPPPARHDVTRTALSLSGDPVAQSEPTAREPVVEPGPAEPGTTAEPAPGLGLMPTVGAVLAERYRILALLGVGGMGMVYRAYDEQLGVEVAVKLLRPEQAGHDEVRRRFRQELILARQVSHRNVVRIHDIGQAGDATFLTMDYVAGRSLRQILEQDGSLPLASVLAIVEQIAAALGAAHAEGIVHRDLKPANILIDPGGRAYVTDFGIARSLATTRLTVAGSVLGTPEYLAPEQAKGEPVDQRADLYALGLIFFELISGELPFPGTTLDEILTQRIYGAPRSLADVGITVAPAIEGVIARCLARDPAERYASAAELAVDLALIQHPDGRVGATGPLSGRLAGAGWTSSTSSSLERASGWRRLGVAGMVLMALALLTAGLVWRLRPAAGKAAAAAPTPAEAASPAPVVPPRHRVAVLPLADETGRGDLAWISTGIAEMVAADLAESPVLAVIDGARLARTLEDLKLPHGPLPEADLARLAELLDVDRLVVGRVRAAGDRLRLDAQLLPADHPGEPLARLGAEGGQGEVFRLIADLEAELRQKLAVEATAVERAAPPSPAGLAAYAEGLRSLRGGDSVASLAAFERAVASDRGYADAWLALAETAADLGYRDRAGAAATRAVELLSGNEAREGYAARALAARLEGRTEEAQEVLRQRLERFPHDVEARVDLAMAYADGGRYDLAAPLLTAVTAADPNHPRAWFLLGKHAILSGDSRRAMDEYLVRALVVQRRLGNRRGQAEVTNALGAAAEELGERAAAREHYQEAAELRRQIGDRRGWAASLANLAALDATDGKYDAARASLEQARELRRAVGDQAGLASVANQLGTLAERQGRYREALDHFRTALELRRGLGDQRAVAESANNVGFAYTVLGELDNAAAYQQQSLDLSRTSGNREGVVFATQGLGQIALARGDWTGANNDFLAALADSRAIGLTDAEAVSRGSLGRIAQLQGRFAAALASYAEARQLLEPLGNLAGLVEFSLFEAETDLALGLPAAAATRLAEAREHLARGPNREQEAELYRLEGLLASAQGRPADAVAALDRAAKVAGESGNRIKVLEVRRDQAELRQATAELRAVATEGERIGHLPLELSTRTALAAALWRQGQREPAEGEARQALRLARRCAPWGGTFQLYHLLAEVLAAKGAAVEAEEERGRAQQEVARLLGLLTGAERDAFAHRPEVASLVTTTTGEETAGEETPRG